MGSSKVLEKPLLYFMFLFNSLILTFVSVVIFIGTAIIIDSFLQAVNSRGIWFGLNNIGLFILFLVPFAFVEYISFLVRKGMCSLKVTKEINLLIVGAGRYLMPIIIYFWFIYEQQNYYIYSMNNQTLSFNVTVIIVALVFMFLLDLIFEKLTKKPEPEIIY